MLRIESLKPDHAPSAILELVDGPKDMRFAMTARTIARQRSEGLESNEMTLRNVQKVTRYRQGGKEELEKMVAKMSTLEVKERDDAASEEARWGGKV